MNYLQNTRLRTKHKQEYNNKDNIISLDIVLVIANQKYNKIVIDTIDYRNEKALSTDNEKAIKVHEKLKVSHTLT